MNIAPATESTAALRGRSLLSTEDWATDELLALLRLARALELLDRAGVRLAFLPHQIAWALYFDLSTRTRSAWAGAAARLGMHPVIVDGSATQTAHGESPEELGTMLAMNTHALGVRHDVLLGEGSTFMQRLQAGIAAWCAEEGTGRAVPMVNLQCDVDHPTQTLADLSWLREHFGGRLDGRRITVSWAHSPSYAKPLSVPQGLVTLLTRFGAHVTLAHPDGYPLHPHALEAARRHARESGGSFRVVHSMDEAFRGAEAVYPKSWGPMALLEERGEASHARDAARSADVERRALEQNARHRGWICDERRMGLTDSALYLHCLPADIGSEVSAPVWDRFRTAVARQARRKLYVIMAALAASLVDDLGERLERAGHGRS